MSWMEELFGSRDKMKKMSLLDENQQKGYDQYLQQIMQQLYGTSGLNSQVTGFLEQMLGGEGFDAYRKPAMRRFNEETAPGIAERFAGIGGGLGSSGFQQNLGSAAAGMEENLQRDFLQSQMQSLPFAQQQAQSPFSNMQNAMGTKTFENYIQPGKSGFLAPLLEAGISGFTGGMGKGLTGGVTDIFRNMLQPKPASTGAKG